MSYLDFEYLAAQAWVKYRDDASMVSSLPAVTANDGGHSHTGALCVALGIEPVHANRIGLHAALKSGRRVL
jgi:hypothetical protein